ncbi:MAG: hypothetical protein ACLFVW_00080 [Phycisphaerae bacterium]
MNITPDILAQGEGAEWVQVVFVLLVVAASAIWSWLRKTAERRADEEDLQRRRQQQGQQGASGEQADQKRYKPIPPRQQQSPAHREQRRPAPTAQQQQRPLQPPPRPAPQAQSQTPEALRAAQTVRQQQLANMRQQEAERRRRQREAIRQQQQKQLELKRRRHAVQQRTATRRRKTASKSSAGLAKLRGLTGMGGRSSTRPAGQEGPRSFGVSLGSTADARRAMVYHEIFSRPKALRRGPELWDI